MDLHVAALVPVVEDSFEPGTLGGSALASWSEAYTLGIAYVVVVAILYAYGSRGEGDRNPLGALQRIGRGLTRLTGIPGWAAIAIGQSMFALIVAGVGFYSDVAWHVALGRDEELFTAPHTLILVGLLGILSASVLGIVVATLDRWDRGWRVGGFTVPYSLLPLGALGVGAVSGFPIDEVWHAAYGIDVTMWSPTHMLMILGASFVGLAAWLIMADTGVRPRDGRWAAFLHGLAAWLTLQGLVAGQGEFSFGVPQYPQVHHPLLISMAAGLGLVAIRLVMGRGRALLLAVIYFATQFVALGGDGGPVETRHGATFVVSAVVVEAVAAMIGTRSRTRFALVAGLGIGTVGLAGEWAWNANAHQPWNSSLLPYAVPAAVVGAMACAVLGAGFAGAFSFADRGRPVHRRALRVAVVLAVAPVWIFLDREPVTDVVADITLTEAASDEFDQDAAFVTVALTPADAADDAHWFQATSWQGGGLVLADMVEIEDGVWRSETPVPVSGHWKTLVRLHRNGTEMGAAPVWFPPDPEIDEPEIPAIDRTVAFSSETEFLLRETFEGTRWVSPVVHGYLAVTLMAWLAAFVVGVRRIGGSGIRRDASAPEPAAPAPV